MNYIKGIYLIIGVFFAIIVWSQRHNREIPYPYASAFAIFLLWPVFIGVLAGQYVKSLYYKIKDGQPK